MIIGTVLALSVVLSLLYTKGEASTGDESA